MDKYRHSNRKVTKIKEQLKTLLQDMGSLSKDYLDKYQTNDPTLPNQKMGKLYRYALKETLGRIVTFNHDLNNCNLKEIEKKDVAEVIRLSYVPNVQTLLPSYLIDINIFEQHSLFDWKVKYFFHHKIRVETIECLSPYVRQGIRLTNRSYMSKLQNKDSLKNTLSHITEKTEQESSLDMALFLLEIGVVTPEHTYLLLNLVARVSIPPSTKKTPGNIDGEQRIDDYGEDDHDDGSALNYTSGNNNHESQDDDIDKDSQKDKDLEEDISKIILQFLQIEKINQSTFFEGNTIKLEAEPLKYGEESPQNPETDFDELKRYGILEKMAKCLLQIVILEADSYLVINPGSSQEVGATFYEKEDFSKQVLTILFKILDQIDDPSSMPNKGMRSWINKIFMIFLSVRNDPIVLSLYQKDIDINLCSISDGDSTNSSLQPYFDEMEKLKTKVKDVLQGRSDFREIISEEDFQLIEVHLKKIQKLIKSESSLIPIAITGEYFNILLLVYSISISMSKKSMYPILDKNILMLIKDHPSTHALMFSVSGRHILTPLIDLDLTRAISIVSSLVEKDSAMIFKNEQLYCYIYENFSNKLISIMAEKKDLERIGDEMFRQAEILIQIYLINDLFRMILKNNTDNEEERALTSNLQFFYQEIIEKEVLGKFRSMIEAVNAGNFRRKQYEPTLIFSDFDTILTILKQLKHVDQESKDFADVVDMMSYDVYYSFLNVFNEAVDVWKFVPLDTANYFDLIHSPHLEESKPLLEADNSNSQALFTLRGMDFSALFHKQFAKLYCNLELFEYGLTKHFQNDRKVILKNIQKYSKNIESLISLAGSTRPSKDDNIQLSQKSFVLEGLLRSCLKLFSGVQLVMSAGKDSENYEKSGINSVLDAFQSQASTILKLIGLSGSQSKKYLDIMKGESPSGAEGDTFKDSHRSFQKSHLSSQMISQKQITGPRFTEKDILNTINMIRIIFEDQGKKELSQNFTRESIVDLQNEFSKENPEGTQAYKNIFFQGSLGIEEFILRVYRKMGKNDQESQDFSDFFLTKGLQNIPFKNELYKSYICKKAAYLRKKDTAFNTFLKAGDDTIDVNCQYKLFFSWLVYNFQEETVKDSYREKLASWDGSGIVHINILKDTYLLAWVNILDNLMVLDPISRDVFFEEYLQTDWEEFKKDEKVKNGELSDVDLEYGGGGGPKSMQEYDQRTQVGLKKPGVENTCAGREFIRSLFKAAIFFQKNIRNEVFDRCFLMNMSYYISICNAIKGLAEDNYNPLKEYVGYLVDEEFHQDPEKQKSYLDIFFEGLYINPFFNPDKVKYTRDDRPDLSWYNIVTLETLSEYFNGPCRRNQELYVKNFKILISFLEKTNSNTMSTFYELQEGIVDFIRALIEGDNPEKCEHIEESCSPTFLYNNIVNFVRKIYKAEFRTKKSFKKVKNSEEIVMAYCKDPRFGKHPGILAALGMFFIMKSVSNESKKFARFLDDKTVKMAIMFTEEDLDITVVLHEQIKNKKHGKHNKDVPPKIANNTSIRNTTNQNSISQDPSSNNVNSNHFSTMPAFQSTKIQFSSETSQSQFISKNKSNDKDDGKSNNKNTDSDEEQEKKDLTYFHFINKISGSVEIVCDDKSTILVHFPIVPECRFLSDTTKINFQQVCNIDDTASKVLDLMNRLPEFRTEMDYNINTYQYSESIYSYSTEDAFSKAMIVTYIIGVAINMLCILGYEYIDPPQPATDQDPPPIPQNGVWLLSNPYKTLVLILYLVLIGMSVIFLAFWFIFKYPKSRKLAHDQIKREGNNVDFDSWEFFFKTNVMQAVISQFVPCMFGFHLIFSVGSYFSPIFHTFHLFLLLYLSTTARYVIKSITEHYSQLLTTLILALFITYSYSMLNAMYYRGQFDDTDSDGMDLCNTLLSCLVYVVDFGLRNGGGIGDSHSTYDTENGYFGFYLKIAFNLSFFISINLVSLNIIFGIIIDTFAELRDEQQARDQNIENTCFICGYERKDFEKQERSFSFHLKSEHQIWNYVNYMVYLEVKDPEEFSGIEHFVHKKLVDKSVEWFPIGDTSYLNYFLTSR